MKKLILALLLMTGCIQNPQLEFEEPVKTSYVYKGSLTYDSLIESEYESALDFWEIPTDTINDSSIVFVNVKTRGEMHWGIPSFWTKSKNAIRIYLRSDIGIGYEYQIIVNFSNKENI